MILKKIKSMSLEVSWTQVLKNQINVDGSLIDPNKISQINLPITLKKRVF